MALAESAPAADGASGLMELERHRGVIRFALGYVAVALGFVAVYILIAPAELLRRLPHRLVGVGLVPPSLQRAPDPRLRRGRARPRGARGPRRVVARPPPGPGRRDRPLPRHRSRTRSTTSPRPSRYSTGRQHRQPRRPGPADACCPLAVLYLATGRPAGRTDDRNRRRRDVPNRPARAHRADHLDLAEGREADDGRRRAARARRRAGQPPADHEGHQRARDVLHALAQGAREAEAPDGAEGRRRSAAASGASTSARRSRPRSGVTEEQLKALHEFRDSDLFDEDEKLVLEYAEGISRTPVEVSDELFDRLRARFDDAQIVELTTAAAIENFRARFNWALGIGSQDYSAEGAYCLRPETLPPATRPPRDAGDDWSEVVEDPVFRMRHALRRPRRRRLAGRGLGRPGRRRQRRPLPPEDRGALRGARGRGQVHRRRRGDRRPRPATRRSSSSPASATSSRTSARPRPT